ncbi:MAG: hypothetical protein H6907_14575 [Hyphomicrobiales bacterium]|nr:hypothetical protein [Hyphomicrobiales bacterium]
MIAAMMKTNLKDSEIVRSATQLVKRHGRDAVIVAEMHAEELLGLGDMDGYRLWKRLAMLVDGLLPQENTANRGLLH